MDQKITMSLLPSDIIGSIFFFLPPNTIYPFSKTLSNTFLKFYPFLKFPKTLLLTKKNVKSLLYNVNINKYKLFLYLVQKNLYIKIIRKLLDCVDPSVKNNKALKWASIEGYIEVVKVLLKDKRTNPSDGDNRALRWASIYGHHEVVKVLLKDERTDPSNNDNDALRYASQNGHLEVVKVLLKDERTDPSDDDNFALILASDSGNIEVVKVLLKDERTDPSAQNNLALRLARRNGHYEVVELLLKDGRR